MADNAAQATVLSGLDVWVADGFAALAGKRVGVVTHPASVDKTYTHLLTLMQRARVNVAAIFGPEHGILGHAQDMVGVDDTDKHPAFGCPIYSLYGANEASLSPKPEWLRGLDVLVIDMQDVGSRYYTFVWTAVLCMRVAAKAGVSVVVLDRPNPLGGLEVEGGAVDAGFHSFVGLYDVPVRHGVSVGEMLRLVRAEEKLDVALEVVKAPGWSRQRLSAAQPYAWVFPSPNMPTYDTALVYPGMCLLEATNASEGRGTTKPFEVVGAGYVDAEDFARRLMALAEPGIVARPLGFHPMFHKFGGKLCGGVQLHVTDAEAFKPFRFGLRFTRLLAETYANAFKWRTEPYEFVSDRNAFDLLTGTSAYRLAFASEQKLLEVYAERETNVARFLERRRPHLLY